MVVPCRRHDPMNIGQNLSVVINTGNAVGHKQIPLRINVNQNLSWLISKCNHCLPPFINNTTLNTMYPSPGSINLTRYDAVFFSKQDGQN
jgi:hypothetical protein